jgi:hypothetical protein
MKLAAGLVVFLGLAGGTFAANWAKTGSGWEGSWANYKMTVDPSKAGRITGFLYKNANVIVSGGDQGGYFWPAPQSRWWPNVNWPPPPSFNDNTYTATTENGGATLVLTGPVDTYKQLRVSKRFSYDATTDQMVLTYATANTASDTARHFAPWEITRGFTGSLVFFPKATSFKFANPSGSGLQPDLPLTRDDSLGWYLDKTYTSNKFFRDGAEGWLAQFKDSILFVKQYPDVDSTQFAPWESDIEIYTGGSFIENEVLGPWTAIQPGDSLVWTVRWGCAILAKTANSSVGSDDLKKAARALAKAPPVSVKPVRSRFLSAGSMPLVDVRGRLLTKSDRSLKAGSLGVLPVH